MTVASAPLRGHVLLLAALVGITISASTPRPLDLPAMTRLELATPSTDAIVPLEDQRIVRVAGVRGARTLPRACTQDPDAKGCP